MKASLSIALLLSAAMLTACGSSSSDDEQDPSGPTPNEESFEKFDLSAYEAKTITADTLAGTWVYMATGEYSGSSGGIQQENTSKSKWYFVIRTADLGDDETDCNLTFRDMWIDGNNVPFPCEFSEEMTDGEKIVGTYDGDINTFEMIKISDSEEAIGTVNYTIAGEEPVTIDVSEFYQEEGEILVESGHAAGSHKGLKFRVVLGDGSPIKIWDYNGVDIEGHDSLTLQADDSWFYMGHDLDEEGTGTDTVSYSMDAESTFANTMSANGSNDTLDVSGTIQIQLPVQ